MHKWPRKQTVLVICGVTLVAALSGFFWWCEWRNAPEQKVPRLLRELRDAQGRGKFFSRRRHLIEADLDNVGPSAVPALIEALNDVGDPSPAISTLAARQFGKLGDARAVEPLIRCMQENPQRVGSVAHALGQIGDPRAVDVLISHLENGPPDGEVMVALAQVVITCLNAENEELKGIAIESMAKVGNRRAVDLLVYCLTKSQKPDLERKAIQALNSLGAFEILIQTLENDKNSTSVRCQAAEGLGGLRDPRAIPALTKAADGPRLPPLNESAKGALQHLQRK